MLKKVIAISGIFGFVFVTQHTWWVERLFNLEPVGESVTPYLLGLIIAILIFKK